MHDLLAGAECDLVLVTWSLDRGFSVNEIDLQMLTNLLLLLLVPLLAISIYKH